MTRCEEDYNPKFVFDTPCKTVEVGLGREPRRTAKMTIVSDPLHAVNHTNCTDAFNSRLYPDMAALNKESVEQFNSLIRGVQSSVSYMTYDNYLQAIKIFVMFYNL